MKLHWTGLVLGAWIMISPWLLGFSDDILMRWSNVICGIILVIMNAWALSEKK